MRYRRGMFVCHLTPQKFHAFTDGRLCPSTPYRAPKKMYYPVLWPELEAICLQTAGYKFCNLTLFIRLRRKIKNINNISLKFIMLTDNNQIFRNCFVIVYCDLTKVSSQINRRIIYEPNELSITLSTL